MARYFGTDGIRGVAGEDLTAELAFRLGEAVGFLMGEERWEPRVFIGGDSRISTPMLESALAAGLMSTGCDVYLGGILPTPVVAFLTRRLDFPLGCVISASHNPIEDNGIKFFDRRGMKVEDGVEDRLEDLLESDDFERPQVTGEAIGRPHDSRRAADEYVRFLSDILQGRIGRIKVVVDAAFGAASTLAPSVFTLLGASVIPLNCLTDGSRINVGCGATHPEPLMAKVLETGADLGVALDGDADRAILVDEKGKVVDGDQVLAMWGLHLLRKKALPSNTVVGTVLSNKGLEVALEAGGGRLLRAPVGDKYVLREMLSSGAVIGGEQSGHLIFLENHTTGDGVLTGLKVAALMRETGKPLSALASQMARFPQVQLNIEVKDKKSALESSKIKKGIAELSLEIDKLKGRLLVRPSGTESVIRVMTEAPEEDTARRTAQLAIDLFRSFSESGNVTEI
jgi:phosphoglucosamine mutase